MMSTSVVIVWRELSLESKVPEMGKVKVTRYLKRCLQRCLASKRCSASGLNCRYLNPNIKLKLIQQTTQLNQEF